MSDFKVIKSTKQYHEYVTIHKNMWMKPTSENEDDRELLEVLIDKWESENLQHTESDPVELLKFLMENHGIDATQLSKELGVNKSTTSKILNYKKGMSKYMIRKLAERFKLSQEAFNREYSVREENPKKVSKKVKLTVKNKARKKIGTKKLVRR